MRKIILVALLGLLPFAGHGQSTVKPIVNGGRLFTGAGGGAPVIYDFAWTPAAIDTVGWYDASDVSTITFGSGVNVTQWDDNSGNLRHMTVSGGQPDYATNTINGLATLFYSGTSDQLAKNLASSVDVTNLVMAAVGMGAMGDWPAYGYVKSTDGTDAVDHRHQSGTTSGKVNPSFKINGTAANAPTANSTNLAEYVPCISIVYYDGTKTVTRANGGELTAQNTGAPDGATFTIDRIQCGRQSNTPRNYQGEYIILDTADIDTIYRIEGYLAWKWGIVDKLPAGHPYKAGPPLKAQ